MTICRIILSLAQVCRIGVWFGFVGSALLLAVGTCVILSFEAMPGLCCFLRVTLRSGGFKLVHYDHVALNLTTVAGLVA